MLVSFTICAATDRGDNMRTYSRMTGLAISGLIILGGCSGKHDETAGNSTAAAPAGAIAPESGKLPKQGLWETVVTADGMPQPMKMQMCVGAPAPGANPFAPPPQAGQSCTKSAFDKTGAGYTIDIECKMNGMTMQTKGDVTGDFSSNYKVSMKTKMSGAGIPAEMQTERGSTAESKYLGACPADMKPGTAKQIS